MSDTSNFDFGKFVPGFDFLQSLTKGASSSIPQMPSLSNWVAPTISVEELEKRIDELKAVQFWLDQNSRALTATVQALEVQKMTLATLKGMNFNMGDVANAFKLKTADTVMSSVQKAADAMTGAAGAMANAASAVTRAPGSVRAAEPAQKPMEAPAPSAPTTPLPVAEADAPAPAAVIDPMQWWGALTSQFQEIATNAMKDAAKQTALDTSKNIATGLATEALKTATGLASEFAAKSMQTLQDGAKRAASAGSATKKAAPAAAKPAAKKAATKPAAKSPAKSVSSATAKRTAQKTTTSRSPARKRAG